MINRDLITLLLQQEIENTHKSDASKEYISVLNCQIVEVNKLLQDGETLESHDIVVVLYTYTDKFYTTYVHNNNNLTDQEVHTFLCSLHINYSAIQLLKVWRN